MKDFMLQVLSNTGVNTEWFLAAVRAPDWQLLQWTLEHEHFSRISLLAHTQLINLYIVQGKKKEQNLPISCLQLEELYKDVGSGKGPPLLSSVSVPGLKLQDKPENTVYV